MKNFCGEPIHQQPFLDAIDRIRRRVVGRRIMALLAATPPAWAR